MRRLESQFRTFILLLLWQQRRNKSSKRNTLGSRVLSPPSQNSLSSSRWTRGKKLTLTASELLRSEDVAENEERLNVERHFSVAMTHLRAPTVSPHVVEEGKKQKWKDIVSTLNADGYAYPKNDAGAAPSFFDEGGVDIRCAVKRRGARGAGRSRHESLSPDVLRLSAGNTKQHGFALAGESNLSPADPTIEPECEEGRNVYGDTPVQITDMLKERLMELKAEKLREDRNDTYLPRRLRLLPDSEVQKMLKQQKTEREFFAGGKFSGGRGKATTLANIEEGDNTGCGAVGTDVLMTQESKSAISSSYPAVESIFCRSADFIPGGSLHDPLTKYTKDFNNFNENPNGSSVSSVYLLRCLPRAGFCSRREALSIIASGQVRVDNVVERNPFRLVRAENNIHVDSHSGRLRFAPPRLWMYHKPAHVIVSRNDVAGRTIITKHSRILGMDHLVPVGSLPMRAHGLLLLTNDGELSSFLENPRSAIQQTYLLRVRPAVDPVLAHKLNTEGIMVNGKKLKNVEFFVNPAMRSRFFLKVKVRGEMIPIAHLMQHLGRTVERGGRISFGPFSMTGLAVGSIREVTVPPYYMRHSGAIWKEFIERDWPFFRRQRITRLRRLSRYRELSPKELEELDNFTYEELKDTLSFESQELASASEERLSYVSLRNKLDEEPLPSEFGTADFDGEYGSYGDDKIIEDITAVS